jgi:hypothetical protein
MFFTLDSYYLFGDTIMGCVAVNVDITIYERGTYSQIFQWKIGDPAIPVDLTGYSAVFTVREKIRSEASLLSLTQSDIAWSADGLSGIYFDEALDGKYKLYINDVDTQPFCPLYKDVDGVYDLFLTNVSGEVVLKQYGVCHMKASVTR